VVSCDVSDVPPPVPILEQATPNTTSTELPDLDKVYIYIKKRGVKGDQTGKALLIRSIIFLTRREILKERRFAL